MKARGGSGVSTVHRDAGTGAMGTKANEESELLVVHVKA